MKIIAFRRSAGSQVALPPEIDILHDSAITVANRPLFLPDFASEWEGHVAPAFRISRLGKEIGRKYASRYYDAVTLALRIRPVGFGAGNSDIINAFDSCITLGPWQSLTSDESGQNPMSLDVKWQDLSVVLTPDELRIDEAIEAVSHYCTLKTGDVVMPCTLPGVFPLSPDRLFEATLNSLPITVKIK